MDQANVKIEGAEFSKGLQSAFDSPTFNIHMSIRVDQPVGSMSISPCGRDVVLASRQGLHIIDLDSPYSPPRHLPHRTPWEVADVQWSPFATRDYWVVSTSNQKALVWNLATKSSLTAVEHVLHAHTRAITDINFSAHHPDILATCAVDSLVHCWDLRNPARPSMSFCDWFAGATQVKWNRQNSHIIASSHDKFLRIWDERKGAYPLRSIEAHDTKIYGIDWNRTRSSGIVTCSLDRSIKFWNYEDLDDEPERVIRSPFPVWRARHTPMGWGLLAMPQRENSNLHLYDRRLSEGVERDAMVAPAHRFEGHQDQVKEFLWRFRGDVVDNIDHREFQLVTWGTDRDLRLHLVDERVLDKIGHRKSQELRKGLNITRKGAPYKTFRDEDLGRPQQKSAIRRKTTSSLRADAAKGSSFTGAISAGMSKAPIPQSKGWGAGGYVIPSTGMQVRRKSRKVIDAIDWMKGVKIGKSDLVGGYGRQGTSSGIDLDYISTSGRLGDSWESPESLGDEITQAAARYSKVSFERVDVPNRLTIISMNGPWGHENKMIYVKVTVRFPTEYPQMVAPAFELQKTTSIPQNRLDEMAQGLRHIAEAHVSRQRGCLEALISYLLGEQSLEESTEWLFEGQTEGGVGPDALGGQISSDEEDNLDLGEGVQLQGMENSATELLGIIPSHVNVPLPKACGAAFSKDGRLVCFFPPREERFKGIMGPLFSKDSDRSGKAARVFQGFGRLQESSPGTKATFLSLHEDRDGESESDDSFTSSSSSSSFSEDLIDSKLRGFPRWRKLRPVHRRFPRPLSTDNSQFSVGQGSSSLGTVLLKPKNTVSIHRVDDLHPAKKTLAEDYIILGEGPAVCQHNAEVAQRHGYHQLADIWEFAKLILHNEVPLEVDELFSRDEPVLVMAKRALSDLKRRDSGLDLKFDLEKKSRKEASLKGRIRWGQHPFGRTWLIKVMFDHFERLADIQMLAMLSCVFAEAPVRSAKTPATVGLSLRDKPMASKIPAFSLDYFSSPEMAWNHYHPPKQSSHARKFDTSHTPAGASSFGGSSDEHSSYTRTHTQYPSGLTLPSGYKSGRVSIDRYEMRAHSVAGSPERQHGRRSNASLTSALAANFSRSLSHTAINNSSGKKRTTSPAPMTASGAATPGGVGGVVTWGVNTFISAPSQNDLSRQHTATYSDSEAGDKFDEAQQRSEVKKNKGHNMIKSKNNKVKVRVTMKNSNRFDEEGSRTSSLLNADTSVRRRAYRAAYANLLGVWKLDIQALEMLKFNGLRDSSRLLSSSSDATSTSSRSTSYSKSSSLSSSSSSSSLTTAEANGHRRRFHHHHHQQQQRRHHQQSSSPSLGTKKTSLGTAGSCWKGLDVGGICVRCGTRLVRKEEGQGHHRRRGGSGGQRRWTCPHCMRDQPRMACIVCREMILGVYTPCFSCGHALHAHCHLAWFGDVLHHHPHASPGHGNDNDDGLLGIIDGRRLSSAVECPAGCGCPCAADSSPGPSDGNGIGPGPDPGPGVGVGAGISASNSNGTFLVGNRRLTTVVNDLG